VSIAKRLKNGEIFIAWLPLTMKGSLPNFFESWVRSDVRTLLIALSSG
jgi:hypothetical protein